MKGALVILLVTVAFGCLLFYADRRKKQRARTVSDAPEVQAPAPVEESEKKPQRPEGCCGLHLVTLRLEEVAEWLGALRGRGISLPDLLRDEAFMIIGESSLSRD